MNNLSTAAGSGLVGIGYPLVLCGAGLDSAERYYVVLEPVDRRFRCRHRPAALLEMGASGADCVVSIADRRGETSGAVAVVIVIVAMRHDEAP